MHRGSLRMRMVGIVLVVSLSAFARAQQATPALDEAQIHALITRAAERDLQNDAQQRNYTYIQREEEKKLDGGGRVKSTEVKTLEMMELYGEPVERLIEKDDKPLSPKETAKEEERIQKIVDKRKNESEDERNKRLEKEAKERERGREFVKEVNDAYNFKLVGMESPEGRDAYVIDAEPKPGYEPHSKDAKFLPKFRFRVWIDKADEEWVKLDATCIDTVSIGWFIARVHQGSRILVEQTRVNDEVWLPKQVTLKLDARILFKGLNLEENVGYRNYQKFRAATKIVPAGDPPR